MKLARNPRRSAPTDDPPDQVADTWYIGVDEAGYGPNFGPLVVASTAFRGPWSLARGDWWKALSGCVGRARAGDGLVIDDSKAVYSGPDGDERLARSVRTFLALAGVEEGDLTSTFASLAPDDLASLHAEHWHERNGIDSPQAHASADIPSEVLEPIRSGFRRAMLDVRRPRVRAVFPTAFNQCLEWAPSKADVELTVIRDLLRAQLAAVDSGCARVAIHVDRLGGRRFYRELVEDVSQTAFVFTLEEAASRSVYRFQDGPREVEIEFCVRADQKHLPVAAASMIAKRLRERCMAGFNSFWSRYVESLVPTAGYPGDSKRFLRDIEPHLERLNVPMESLWRKK